MFNYNPLESLAAFAITFAAGVITIVSFSACGDRVKQQGKGGIAMSVPPRYKGWAA